MWTETLLELVERVLAKHARFAEFAEDFTKEVTMKSSKPEPTPELKPFDFTQPVIEPPLIPMPRIPQRSGGQK